MNSPQDAYSSVWWLLVWRLLEERGRDARVSDSYCSVACDRKNLKPKQDPNRARKGFLEGLKRSYSSLSCVSTT